MIIIEDVEKQATYYRLEQKVHKYAREFFEEVSRLEDFVISKEILPLYCFNKIEAVFESVQSGQKVYTNGSHDYRGKQAVIRIGIDGDTDRLNKNLKKLIRHEILHYVLWICNKPCEDDSAEFWAMCYVFDGGAYEPLDKFEQEKYETFTEVFDEYIKELPQKAFFVALYSAIGYLKEFNSKEEYIAAVLNDINTLKKIYHF